MVRGRPLTTERIRRVERRARRAARARRRLIVSALLLVCSVGGWALVGFDRLHWGMAVAPSAMLLFVLFLGRRAARAARRADARWQAAVRAARQRATQARALANGGPYAPRNRAQVTGLATRGSSTETQAIPRVTRKDALDEILDSPAKPKVIEVSDEDEAKASAKADRTAEDEKPAKRDEVPSGRAWDPVPVPLPTYVTKPAAPQRQPAALPASSTASKGPTAAAGTESSSSATGRQVSAGPPSMPPSVPVSSASPAGTDPVAEDELLRGEPPRMKSETLGKPLEEILARRRAAG
jgi:hypothetical protein